MKLSPNSNRTIFSAFIGMLNVKYSQSYADKLYNEHPYKYSLFGLSKMLLEYNIENVGISITNKEKDIKELDVPFIAHTGDDFVIVFKKDEESVSYLWQSKQIDIAMDRFLEIWSGIVLLAEPNKESVEPNYRENQKKEWFSKIQVSLLYVVISGMLLFLYITKGLFADWGFSLSILINLVGVYVCLLLTLKQMHVKSNYADKICSLFQKRDCNNILESKDAKLWGVIGWSEIGLGYFTSNILIIFWFPQFMSYLSLIGCCTLVFSFWSIWYQKIKVGQWCPLCLIVQLLFWFLFVVNVVFGFISMPSFALEQILAVGCIFIVPILCISIVYPKLELGRKVQNLVQEINSIKMRDEVISALLKQQPFHEVCKSDSKIIFGNPQANVWITILTNPHCEPCGGMHLRVERLLDKAGQKICVQYLFSSFNEELEASSKFLISSYLSTSLDETKEIFTNWFKGGKYRKEEFFKRYPQNIEDDLVKSELENHKVWKETARLAATPSILINGYILPRDYRIEDVAYFTEIDVNSINYC